MVLSSPINPSSMRICVWFRKIVVDASYYDYDFITGICCFADYTRIVRSFTGLDMPNHHSFAFPIAFLVRIFEMSKNSIGHTIEGPDYLCRKTFLRK